MKKILLLGAAAAMAGAVCAGPAVGQPQVIKGTEVAVKAALKSAKPLPGARKVAPGLMLSDQVEGNGRVVKKMESRLGMNRIQPANPALARLSKGANSAVKASARISEGMSFEESFEGWDGETLPWYPEGWSLHSKTGQTGVENTTWGPSAAQPFLGIYPSDGDVMMAVSFNQDDPTALQDEWLVSPVIAVKENELLKFHTWIDPFWLFSLDNFDWDLYDWVGERQVTFTLKVLVKEENADWVEVWDATTPWLDTDVMTLLSSKPAELEAKTVSLAEFVGKKVQIAFQFVGKDANTIFLDEVSVGLPELEGVIYDDPAETLYWGFDRTAGWRALNGAIAQYPVYAPLTWINQTYADGATYSWEYCDPETTEWMTSDDEELTVTYVPDYSTEASTRNNWFYAPRLHASAPGATQATYQAPYAYFQAGGKPERNVNTELGQELVDFGLVPFTRDIQGLGFVAEEVDFGQAATPIFGYDENVDAWWLNHTYNGDLEDAFESDHVYVEAIMNYIFPGTAPMVITGANVLAKGQIKDAAEFKLEIIALGEDGVPDMENPMVSATCVGENVLQAEGGVQNYLNVIFDFDTPVVIEPESNGYMVRFSGFHDPDNITYFAPMQSMIPFTHSNVIGWLDKFIKVQGADNYRRSYTPTYYYESEYGMCHTAFAINFSAYHPWLETPDGNEIEISHDGTAVEVPLDSYHPASALTVEAPAGVTAKVSGRYGTAKLIVSHDDTEVIAEGHLTVSGPGVKKVFTVTQSAGINGVSVDKANGATPVAAYTVTGQPVSLDEAVNGVYVVKYSDGTAAKVAVK